MSEETTERFPRAPGDRYEVIESIGRGGMANVFSARDVSLSRTVALKCIKEDLAQDEDLRQRFFNEAEILASLHHPGAVSVHDIGKWGERGYFYAMERVRGRTLTEMLRSRTDENITSRSDLMGLIDVFEKVCQTVGYAHSRDIIHRDLKPGNIMVDEYGAVYVVDWGLAKRLPGGTPEEGDSLTVPGVMMGTPSHMSPEQAQGLPDAGDPQTDVFALGVVLYSILTGSRPFRGRSREETIKEVLFHTPDPPAKINSAAGRELSAICMKALRKDPRRRYPNAGELAEDIRRFRAFLPVSAIRPRLVDRAANWVRRNRVLSAALGTLLAVVLIGGLGYAVKEVSKARFVDALVDRVGPLDAERERLKEATAAVEEKLNSPRTDPAELHRLGVERERLEAKLTVLFLEKRSLLAAVVGFTYDSPDERAIAIAREQILTVLGELMDQEDFAIAEALAASHVDAFDEGRNVVGFTEAEVGRLREYEARAGVELARAMKEGGGY